MNTEQVENELWEVIDHFHKLDLKAREDYQIVSIEDLDKINWLIATVKLLLNMDSLKYY